MRELAPALTAFLGNLSGVKARHLVWITARNRSTGAAEELGVWNGSDVQEFVIGGVTRTYFGAGALLQVPPIVASVGLDVQFHDISLAGSAPEVLQAVRGFDVRLAPIEIHRAVFDPETDQLLAEPHRLLRGTVDALTLPRPEDGESGAITLSIASASRALTRTLTVRKSDAAQRTINPNDKGRIYAAISGAVGVFWGVKNKRGAPPPTVVAIKRDIGDPGGASGDSVPGGRGR